MDKVQFWAYYSQNFVISFLSYTKCINQGYQYTTPQHLQTTGEKPLKPAYVY